MRPSFAENRNSVSGVYGRQQEYILIKSKWKPATEMLNQLRDVIWYSTSGWLVQMPNEIHFISTLLRLHSFSGYNIVPMIPVFPIPARLATNQSYAINRRLRKRKPGLSDLFHMQFTVWCNSPVGTDRIVPMVAKLSCIVLVWHHQSSFTDICFGTFCTLRLCVLDMISATHCCSHNRTHRRKE